jgi:hypothetical protein
VLAAIAAKLADAVWRLRDQGVLVTPAERDQAIGACVQHARTKLTLADTASDEICALVLAATGDLAHAAEIRTNVVNCLTTFPRVDGSYGHEAAGGLCMMTFLRYVVELDIAGGWGHWDAYEKAGMASARFMTPEFTIVSDRSTIIKVDDQNRPHAESGPSHRWADGTKLYYWHGTAVPQQWIEAPDTVDPKLALTLKNVEQRFVLAQILGWTKVLANYPHRVIDVDADPMIGTLIEVDLPDLGPSRFIRVLCGTGRTFLLEVDNDCTTALEANARRCGITPDLLRQVEART